MDMNDALRNGTFDPSNELGKKISDMTNAISKSTLEEDTWLTRGTSINSVSKLLGVDVYALTDDDVDDLVGMEFSDDAFMSCGSTKNTGFTKSCQLRIFAPKGTEAIYAEPFSAYGFGSKDWDGVSTPDMLSGELETIIQRGSRMVVTDAAFTKSGKLNLEVVVVSQKYKN